MAVLLSRSSSGRVSHRKPRIGNASSVAEYSGWEMDHDLGAISPTTRCRNVTMISARMNAMTSADHNGRPQLVNSGVSQWCTAGLVIEPSASAHRVMPSCAPASSRVSSEALRRAARAATLVAAASSSRWRRAEMSENSTATKNADAMINSVVAPSTTHGLFMIPEVDPAARWVTVIGWPPRPPRTAGRAHGVRSDGPRCAGSASGTVPRTRRCPAGPRQRGRPRRAGRRRSR